MKKKSAKISRVGLRAALRSPVGRWKQWREAQIVPQLKHQLAVCAIFREEALFLDEWLAFHAGIGVSHFYLYNNFSTDNYRAVLQPWQTAGFVTLIEWPVTFGQMFAYRNCLRRFKNDARWIAFLDVDEFLFAPRSPEILPVLDSFAHLPGIEVWHVYFGTDNHVKRPASVTGSYTSCAPADVTTVKTITNPRMVYKIGVHQSKYWRGEGQDTSGHVAGPQVTPVFDVLRINHYWSRSLEDLHTKARRGGGSTKDKEGLDEYLEFANRLHGRSDVTIQPLARTIRHPLTGKGLYETL